MTSYTYSDTTGHEERFDAPNPHAAAEYGRDLLRLASPGEWTAHLHATVREEESGTQHDVSTAVDPDTPPCPSPKREHTWRNRAACFGNRCESCGTVKDIQIHTCPTCGTRFNAVSYHVPARRG